MRALADSQIGKRQQQATTNREEFPFAAEFLDQFTAAGFTAKVVHASNGTRSVGKAQPETGWVNVDELLAIDDFNRINQPRKRK